jgi:single-stranded-DNA-specific exonuclease
VAPDRWRIRDIDGDTVTTLAGALRVLPTTARCIAGRGVATADGARAFLAPRLGALRPPHGMAGMELAVGRLVRAITRNERIGVFGDYDVDGVTTAALLASFLRELGAPCVAEVARRDAGYGLGAREVGLFAERGCTLLVTGDCGTSDVDAIAAASDRGIDVIVVDHHTVPVQDEHSRPHPALALVNPFRADSTFPFRGMASVGLAFYLAAAVRTALCRAGFFAERAEPDMRQLLDLVAVGTIADLVPLVGENRILTRAGLKVLTERRRPGLAALLDRAGVEPSRRIDERDIGWKIAPRMNAPGRLGEAGPALALLLASDRAEGERWAEQLEVANQRRRELQDHVYAEALARVGEPGPAVVVAGEGWPSGVVGIVAAKLVDHFARPAFVIAIDPGTGQGRGSARAVPGVDLYAALRECRGQLVQFGGHAAAAGLTVDRDRVDELRDRLGEAIHRQLAPACGGAAARDGATIIDAEVGLADVSERLARELGDLAPFGNGNEAPLLLARGVTVRGARRVGGDGAHLKLSLDDAAGNVRGAIAFGHGGADVADGSTIDVAFAPAVSEWQGRTRVELTVRQLAPCYT